MNGQANIRRRRITGSQLTMAIKGKVEGKLHPRTRHEGPDGE